MKVSSVLFLLVAFFHGEARKTAWSRYKRGDESKKAFFHRITRGGVPKGEGRNYEKWCDLGGDGRQFCRYQSMYLKKLVKNDVYVVRRDIDEMKVDRMKNGQVCEWAPQRKRNRCVLSSALECEKMHKQACRRNDHRCAFVGQKEGCVKKKK